MSSRTSTLLCSSGIFIFLLLLAGALYYTLILSSPFPLNTVYYARDISLGISFQQQSDRAAALSSIQRIRRSLINTTSWSFTPNISPINVSSLEEYQTLSPELKFFFGYSDRELSDLEPLAEENSVFISPLSHFRHPSLNLIRNNIGAELLAKAYMTYFAAYPRGSKTAIICLLSQEDPHAHIFYEALKATSKASFPRLEISLPLYFTHNSSFPVSDAWQIVSDIGSKLAWARRPYIFFLSDPAGVLPYLYRIVETHPEIAEHPWILRSPLGGGSEEDVGAWDGFEGLVNQVGLISISFFALGDDVINLERRAQCLEDDIPAEKCHIYESLMRFHRSAAKAIQHKTSLESAYEREGFESMQDHMSLTSGILTVRSGLGLMQDLIHIKGGNISAVIMAKECHLHRRTLKPWAQNDSRIDVFLEPTILLPQSYLSFESLREFPEALSIPQTRDDNEFGLHLRVDIDGGSSPLICLPNKLDHGEYVCQVANEKS